MLRHVHTRENETMLSERITHVLTVDGFCSLLGSCVKMTALTLLS